MCVISEAVTSARAHLLWACWGKSREQKPEEVHLGSGASWSTQLGPCLLLFDDCKQQVAKQQGKAVERGWASWGGGARLMFWGETHGSYHPWMFS